MKKLFVSVEHRRRNAYKIKKSLKRKKCRRKKRYRKRIVENNLFSPIMAPTDFRVIENTEKCLLFFRNIRSEESVISVGAVKLIRFSLKLVEKIDYGAISILTAISDDLKAKSIILQGDFPENSDCKKFIIDSGFLNHMYTKNNKPFPKTEKSDMIFFEKGSKILSESDNKKITNLVRSVVKYLTGEESNLLSVKTIILEICGNSIEWSGTNNRQWLLGVKYEEDRVIFTTTDVGKGVLETLHRKFYQLLKDSFTGRSDREILERAFDKKYGSSSEEINRNKGLPSIKANFEDRNILKLKMLTNNVFLDFERKDNSKALPKGSARFKGTFYQWEMTRDCITQRI